MALCISKKYGVPLRTAAYLSGLSKYRMNQDTGRTSLYSRRHAILKKGGLWVNAIVQFFLSAIIIVIAGIYLTRSADAIAEITKLGRLLIGSVLLAAATSLPELLVDVHAVQTGLPNIAVGDLMGSSLFNLLILAIVDLIHKGRKVLYSQQAAIHALSASMSVTVTTFAGVGIFLGPFLASYEIGGIGLGVLGIVVAYALGIRMVYYDQKVNFEKLPPPEKGLLSRRKLGFAIGQFLLAVLALAFASPFLADSAGQIADFSGLGSTFIGTTMVAFCTSLPELVSALSAVRMGAFDLALGNIFGSNAFNMILLAPLDLIHDGPILASVSRSHILTCFATILITSIAIMGQLYQVENRRRIIEPDAFLVIFLALGSLSLLYFLRDGAAI